MQIEDFLKHVQVQVQVQVRITAKADVDSKSFKSEVAQPYICKILEFNCKTG